ncbi:NAD(P)/FAD-dependent oxidoreductase [Desmospora profundinema]|uniref:Cation diffusion facilitator CzcD-associated flavoprotein CzcO n=1 Tax=Desmospora profundinema TaxID=1571184 RepID=A0ABU1IH95_9BACL|nr:NAD(P)-binding domain-containing protein [Desmospora profundinema]MDR6224153.1 cation diffusion facilitator CzcD-associated flavoprotein CzcO [Desmospora profundinema]
MTERQTDVLIIGAGPAGVGLGALFCQAGFDRFLLLERDEVGASFFSWPQEMRLITPSFHGHAFGHLDLNAVMPGTSPAFSLKKEHLSGEEYGSYLQAVADHFELPIHTGVDVTRVEKDGDVFRIHTQEGVYTSRFVVWAAGEFSYPHREPFPGAESCIHSSEVESWASLPGTEQVVVGGYESGMDAAIHLVKAGKMVIVLSRESNWLSEEPDPSISLSPYTRERLQDVLETGRLRLWGDAEVVRVQRDQAGWRLFLQDGDTVTVDHPPILATGFRGSVERVKEHFEREEDGNVLLTERDESTRTSGLFLCGPRVKHGNVIFCFIYKFRQRFAVVAEEILRRLEAPYDPDIFQYYRDNQMFLDDLSCCDDECVC